MRGKGKSWCEFTVVYMSSSSPSSSLSFTQSIHSHNELTQHRLKNKTIELTDAKMRISFLEEFLRERG